jgi:hypothetical protein
MPEPEPELHREDGVYPQGRFSAWATHSGMIAEVRRYEDKGYEIIERLEGETAWSDAIRHAGDLNAGEARSRLTRA